MRLTKCSFHRSDHSSENLNRLHLAESLQNSVSNPKRLDDTRHYLHRPTTTCAQRTYRQGSKDIIPSPANPDSENKKTETGNCQCRRCQPQSDQRRHSLRQSSFPSLDSSACQRGRLLAIKSAKAFVGSLSRTIIVDQHSSPYTGSSAPRTILFRHGIRRRSDHCPPRWNTISDECDIQEHREGYGDTRKLCATSSKVPRTRDHQQT